MNKVFCWLLLVTIVTFLPLSAVSEQDIIGPSEHPLPTLAEFLENDGRFKLFLSALKTANLLETLRGREEYTMLAPTDDAFRRLPERDLDLLLVPSGKQKLAELLGMHLIARKMTAAELFQLKKVKTFSGQEIPIKIMAGNYLFDQSKLLQPDVVCSNGMVQVIDRVIQPLP